MTCRHGFPARCHVWYRLAIIANTRAERPLPARYSPGWLRVGNWCSDRAQAIRARAVRRHGGGSRRAVTATEPDAGRMAAATDALSRHLRGFGRQGPAALGWGATPAEIVALVAPYLTAPAEPADEVKCPACGATIRARMSDTEPADDRVPEVDLGD